MSEPDDFKNFIDELQEEIAELEKELADANEATLEAMQKVQEAYITGYMEFGLDEHVAYRSWLQFAAEKGWEI